ncbi:hypothetical protein AAFF_G00137820 [Aldrovandia affinis]|uniref:Uncharacterized protein n=1 Tax=Aldrovandia affinis TaxID=143900 RepID=A0AAD7TC48_9TELE|nr:hypothetical protein AAFF_G00137820 [Aldrovandia affinis]
MLYLYVLHISLTRPSPHKLVGAAFLDYARLLRSMGLTEGAALWASRAGGAGEELLEELSQAGGGGDGGKEEQEEGTTPSPDDEALHVLHTLPLPSSPRGPKGPSRKLGQAGSAEREFPLRETRSSRPDTSGLFGARRRDSWTYDMLSVCCKQCIRHCFPLENLQLSLLKLEKVQPRNRPDHRVSTQRQQPIGLRDEGDSGQRWRNAPEDGACRNQRTV